VASAIDRADVAGHIRRGAKISHRYRRGVALKAVADA